MQTTIKSRNFVDRQLKVGCEEPVTECTPIAKLQSKRSYSQLQKSERNCAEAAKTQQNEHKCRHIFHLKTNTRQTRSEPASSHVGTKSNPNVFNVRHQKKPVHILNNDQSRTDKKFDLEWLIFNGF